MARTREGVCAICGEQRPLTFEHVPPQSAFNNKKVLFETFYQRVGVGSGKARVQMQRGQGAFSLCARCNSNTGTWYAARFVDWCRKSMELLERMNGRAMDLVQVHDVYPLAILKQVVAMFCSIGNPILQPSAARFLLNREARGLWPKLRFFMYYNLNGEHRHVPLVGRGGGKGFMMLSEFSFPPFGYVMTVDGAPPPDDRLFEITWFKDCPIDQRRFIEMRLPVLETASPFPGDYRTADELARDTAEGIQLMRERETINARRT